MSGNRSVHPPIPSIPLSPLLTQTGSTRFLFRSRNANMRIIAGKFRGKQLKGPRGTLLRPTSDRLKETLFGILGSSISDTVFVDAFAGSGSVGLEALSRGAREVLFIESNAQALRL